MNATTTPSQGLAGGVAARDAAHAVLSARRGDIIRLGQRALLRTLLLCDVATADDVRDAVDVPAAVNPVCLGAVPAPLARAGIIVRDGFEATTRRAGHARPVSRWRLLDRSAAVRWLDAHPAPPETPTTPTGGAASCDAWPTPLFTLTD